MKETRQKKIEKLKKIIAGKCEPKVYIVIDRNGVKTCSAPGWPDDVQEDDIVFHIEIIHNKKTDNSPTRN